MVRALVRGGAQPTLKSPLKLQRRMKCVEPLTQLSPYDAGDCLSILARMVPFDMDNPNAIQERQRQSYWARKAKSRAVTTSWSGIRRPIFNIGLPRTGTISLHEALSRSALNPCKWVPSPRNMSLKEIAAFALSPSQVHRCSRRTSVAMVVRCVHLLHVSYLPWAFRRVIRCFTNC